MTVVDHAKNAKVLRSSLKSLRAEGLGGLSAKFISWGGLAAAIGSVVKPQGPGKCDHNGLERAFNVISSIPFFAIGLATIKRRRTAAGKVYGGSVLGVGVASMTFHATKGRARKLFRKADYWAIAISTSMMTRALFPKCSPWVWGTPLCLTPFQPFGAASFNTLAMEVEYLRRSCNNPKLTKDQQLHAGAAAVGMGLFYADDGFPKVPCTHGLWHCAAAVSCATTNALLADIEEKELNLPAVL